LFRKSDIGYSLNFLTLGSGKEFYKYFGGAAVKSAAEQQNICSDVIAQMYESCIAAKY